MMTPRIQDMDLISMPERALPAEIVPSTRNREWPMTSIRQNKKSQFLSSGLRTQIETKTDITRHRDFRPEKAEQHEPDSSPSINFASTAVLRLLHFRRPYYFLSSFRGLLLLPYSNRLAMMIGQVTIIDKAESGDLPSRLWPRPPPSEFARRVP